VEKSLKVVAAVLCVLVAGTYAWKYWLARESADSPEKLAREAIAGADAESRQLACARLVAAAGRLQQAGSRNAARDHLVQVFKESTTPGVRAAAMCGLASLWDYDSMDLMLDALGDDAAEVRTAARQAILGLLCLDPSRFGETASGDDRQAQAKELRDRWDDFRRPGPGGVSQLDLWKRRLADRDQSPNH
jgi:hypothetical protein